MPKTDFSKAILTMAAVADCRVKRGVEMKAGYWTYKTDKGGNITQEWKEDTRKVFIYSVQALRNLLAPEIIRNKTFITIEKGFNNKKVKLFNKYAYEEREIIDPNSIQPNAKQTGLKFMPTEGSEVVVLIGTKWVNRRGGWDTKIDYYLNGLLELADKKYAALNVLIDRLGYFKQVVSYG